MVSWGKTRRYGVVCVSLISAALPAVASELMPHKVTYQLRLQDADPGTAIQDITGKTIFRLVRECDGWKSGEDYLMQMQFEDGSEIYMASIFESFEDFEGELFSFTIDERSNYDDDLRFDGFAQQAGGNDTASEAYFSIEPDNAIMLPDDTYYPVAQTKEILKRARQGETFFNSHIFFGAKPDNALKKTSVIIGREQSSELEESASDLLSERYYPVQVAYFDPASTTGTPSYEITFHMQDNGIVPFYVIDYGDFRLQARLDDIEEEPSQTCS